MPTTLFEPQILRSGERRCGAATLVMVYRSFGSDLEQETVWSELRSYSVGKSTVRTFHLARHALEHGLSAVVVRLRHPAEFLFEDFSSVRMIPVHRIRRDSGKGHFSLFLGADAETQMVSLHDPQLGPHRSLKISEFLELWTPWGTDCEITSNIAVLIAESRTEPTTCSACSRLIFLDPLRFFPESAFETSFCPFCDARTGVSDI